MFYTHMEVFPCCRKTALGPEPLKATGSNVGRWKKLHFFTLASKMMGWYTCKDKVPPLTTFLNLHVFRITTPPLISVFLCFHSHCSPPGMCSSMTNVKTNLKNVSASAFSITSLYPSSSSFASPAVTPCKVCSSGRWKKDTYCISTWVLLFIFEWKELTLFCFMWCRKRS